MKRKKFDRLRELRKNGRTGKERIIIFSFTRIGHFSWAVVLSTRPPISLRRITVSPAVIDDLERFVGHGKIGAPSYILNFSSCLKNSAWHRLSVSRTQE